MPFSFDPGWLLLSMVVSSAGAVIFMYGKRETRLPHMVFGGIFFLYPYFVQNAVLMLLIAAILGVCLWATTRMGW